MEEQKMVPIRMQPEETGAHSFPELSELSLSPEFPVQQVRQSSQCE